MSKLPSKAIPANPRRIVLINPTRFLGNLLLAGGLIQAFAAHCARNDQQLLLVLDASFAELCAAAFPGISVLYYPRQAIAKASHPRKLLLFGRFLWRIRRFNADLAFNIEEDATTSRLTQFSGASFRMGCSPARQRRAYEAVLPIAYSQRPAEQEHRWYSYREVFDHLGLRHSETGYINLHLDHLDGACLDKLHEHGAVAGRPLIAIHSGATKAYKQWPESAFVLLCKLLIKKGFTPVLIGAGREDVARCARLMSHIHADEGDKPPYPLAINLCGQLSLRELAEFFLQCSGIVGNDSGPFHLAAAQGLPGVVIFGPSDPAIWGPLGSRARVLQKSQLCAPGCSRRACYANYRCLDGISAEEVLDNLLELIN